MKDKMIPEITPEFKPIPELEPINAMVQKILPLVYDDSLSYYEVLCKIPAIVNETFQNMDFQDEINKKIDAMIKDGSFEAIIREVLAPLLESTKVIVSKDEVNEKNTLNIFDSGRTSDWELNYKYLKPDATIESIYGNALKRLNEHEKIGELGILLYNVGNNFSYEQAGILNELQKNGINYLIGGLGLGVACLQETFDSEAHPIKNFLPTFSNCYFDFAVKDMYWCNKGIKPSSYGITTYLPATAQNQHKYVLTKPESQNEPVITTFYEMYYSGKKFLIVNLHLGWLGTYEEWTTQMKELRDLLAPYCKSNDFHIVVAGDFNANITNNESAKGYKYLYDLGLTSLYTSEVPAEGGTTTDGRTIDNIFISKNLSFTEYDMPNNTFDMPFFSDHKPIVSYIKILN